MVIRKKTKINKNGRRRFCRYLSRCEQQRPCNCNAFCFFPPNREIKFTKCHKLIFVFSCCQHKTCVFAHCGWIVLFLFSVCSFVFFIVYLFILFVEIFSIFSGSPGKIKCTCGRSFKSWCCDSHNRRTRRLRSIFGFVSLFRFRSLDNVQNR